MSGQILYVYLEGSESMDSKEKTLRVTVEKPQGNKKWFITGVGRNIYIEEGKMGTIVSKLEPNASACRNESLYTTFARLL